VAKASIIPAWQRALIILTGTVVSVVVVACLYWAQLVLIPVALAVFLSFLLSPLVAFLQGRGLGRVPAVLIVVLLATLLLGGFCWMMTHQVTGLIRELPQYTGNIKGKIKGLRQMIQSPAADRIERMVHEISGELKPRPAAGEGGPPENPGTDTAPESPTTVVVQPETPSWLSRLPFFLGHAAETLGGLGLTIILVIFMLLKREDLRNRVIRLVGHGRLTVTTKAVDDAAQRMSRFLVMQVIVNGCFGLALAVGLFLIGVKYALLWGALVGVLRYIPYLGTWAAALLPITLSLAMFEGWLQPLLVIGLFLSLDLFTYNVIEPRMFGKSIGVSEVALLVAAAFWAFLWGPVGLVLANPLTVCLVVLGKHVPQLGFLDVLLGDEPALEPDVTYYQRLLARDQDEATELVLAQSKGSPPEQLYDELLVPSLNYLRRDRERDDLTEADEQYVLRATCEILEDLGERRAAAMHAETGEPSKDGAESPAPLKIRVLGCPARDEADRLALDMLRQLLDPAKWEVEVLSEEMLTAEQVSQAVEERPAVLCIGSLPPGGLAHTRYLCKRLRGRLPAVKVIAGLWGQRGNIEQTQEQLREAGADLVATTLQETQAQLNGWLPVLDDEEARKRKRMG
jgi:predicted PurR-regulated permease PerM